MCIVCTHCDSTTTALSPKGKVSQKNAFSEQNSKQINILISPYTITFYRFCHSYCSNCFQFITIKSFKVLKLNCTLKKLCYLSCEMFMRSFGACFVLLLNMLSSIFLLVHLQKDMINTTSNRINHWAKYSILRLLGHRPNI